MRKLIVDGFADADGFILGRKTYGIFSNYWPKITDPGNVIAVGLNSRPKYVFSRSLEQVGWNNVHLIKGDTVAELRKLRAQPGQTLHTWGSTVLSCRRMISSTNTGSLSSPSCWDPVSGSSAAARCPRR
ncbi:MAG: Dihydrofolate reductase (EC [uncultured Paraburkholderia sp.]|nr:MAG: Dihydrofolate reductase (EC [uncultured Paraburkholderia sp.]CAH2910416.1 MAG: Dihydrofolate reductase (EC [uncultured Paraburkholderia sp.]